MRDKRKQIDDITLPPLYTSYFYQIRNFKRYMIPVSTAMYDPKWYSQGGVHKDKRGIYNGIRAECFHYDDSEYKCECGGVCCTDPKDPFNCGFLRRLRIQYNQLDFNEIINRCKLLAARIQSVEQFSFIPSLVFIFYETPANQCSERRILQEYFHDNGYNLQELKYPINENYLDIF